MKKLFLVLTLAVAAALVGPVGCGSKPKIDPSYTAKRFENAPPEVKAKVQKGLDAIKEGDLGLALAILDELSYELVDVTPEQQASLMDLAQQIRDKLGDQADAALEEGQKKLEQMKAAAESAAESAVEGAAEGAGAETEPQAAAEAAQDTATNAAEAAKGTAEQAAEAAKEAGQKAVEETKKAADAAAEAAKKALGGLPGQQ